MPQFGLGTFFQPSDSVCEQSCLTALKAGYRHIDTAHAYNDEAGVGRAVKESGILARKYGSPANSGRQNTGKERH